MNLPTYLNNLVKIGKNLDFRSKKKFTSKLDICIRYAANDVLERLQRKKKINIAESSKKMIWMKKYISKYKRKQNIVYFFFI